MKRQRLSPQRRALVARIRKLYAANEPLNICAVKRRHPDLMKAVFEIKPFWGWKRALDAAGIDYAKIRVELEPYVKCQICGEYLVVLPFHLLLKHGVDKDDYHIDYPDAPLVSEEFRARQWQRTRRSGQDHWEPLWTPEYVLDRIAELHRRDSLMDGVWMRRHGRPLVVAGWRYFSSWRQSLELVGINHGQLSKTRARKRRRYADKKSVIQAIRARNRRGEKVNSRSLQKGPTADSALLKRAMEYFGSWDRALKAAGFKPSRIKAESWRVHRRYKDGKSVVSEIRRRSCLALPVNTGAMMKGSHVDHALYNGAKNYFGSWNSALKAAGIDSDTLHQELCLARRRYPDKKAVVREIRKRNAEGDPVTHGAVSTGKSADRALVKSAYNYFGTWKAAIQAAGLSYGDIHRQMWLRQRCYPDKQAVIREIRERNRLGEKVNSKSVQRGKAADTDLMRRAAEYFGSWNNALKAAGFDPAKIKAQSYLAWRRYQDKASVTAAIKRRIELRWPVNTYAVLKGAHSDSALYLSAKDYFGSWKVALKAAGVNPDTLAFRR